MLSTSPSEEIKLTKFLKEVLKLKTDNWEKLTSQIQDVSDSVFNNTLILVLSMIHSLVFSVWTFTWFWRDQEAEWVWEEDANQESVPSTEFQRRSQWNGSEENTTVPFTTDIRSFLFNLLLIFLIEFLNGKTMNNDRWK